ncbi:MAG: 2,5-diamino-6-(ribosylamino)-4(3H)-pyrimidinone 5'-phosphate reductase [Thermoplasmata archaeon]|nr:MAG: 2,5-diamino-6-(ribosylamino)-4(3H)-pyrimidinone 5'-phosphate reductase [Thermoplasmata archaeon]
MPPYIIINCAMSADGKIALPSRKQIRISNEEDLKRVHELRNECDAVLVGIGTVLSDDPKLTVKEKYVPNPKQPIRIVLDSKGRIPEDSLVLSPESPTIIAVSEECTNQIQGAETIICGKKKINLSQLCEILDEKGVKTLLVEGGEKVIWSFLKNRLADELNIFVGSMVIGGISSPTPVGGKGALKEEDILPLTLKKVEKLGDGVLLQYGVKR